MNTRTHARTAPAGLRGGAQPIEESQHALDGTGRGPRAVLGDQQPGQRQMLVFTQVGRVVPGGQLPFHRPLLRGSQFVAADPQPGAHRRDRLHVGGEIADVHALGFVEQDECAVEIAFGRTQPGHHDPPTVWVLRQAVVLAETLAGGQLLHRGG